MKAYQDLKQSFQRLHYLSKTIALLDWDHETYPPRKGVGYRADQQAFLSGLAHERHDDRIGQNEGIRGRLRHPARVVGRGRGGRWRGGAGKATV